MKSDVSHPASQPSQQPASQPASQLSSQPAQPASIQASSHRVSGARRQRRQPVNLDSKRTGKHTNKKNKRGGRRRRRRRRRTARLKKKGCRAMVSRLCWKLMWSSAAPAARPRPRFPRGSLLAPFSEKQKPRGRIEIRPHFSRFPATPRPQNHQKQPT